MFDERWPEEAEELAEALTAVLAKHCPPDTLRGMGTHPADTTVVEQLEQLDRALAEFGLWDLPADPYLLVRATVTLGAHLVPTPFVSALPAQLILGEAGVANGIDRPMVPTGLSRVVVSTGIDTAGIADAPTLGRQTAAGESVVLIESAVGAVNIDADVDALRAWGFLLEAARLVGAAQALLRYGVGYVSDRRQFGVPVGSFQGVSHPLAEAATAVQAADLLTRHAAYLVASEATLPMSAAVMAAAKARSASRHAANAVHQALGGYGFTIEADCQLYSRRIRAWSAAMPDPGPWLANLARQLADPATRGSVTDLWQFDHGFTLPRWAVEST